MFWIEGIVSDHFPGYWIWEKLFQGLISHKWDVTQQNKQKDLWTWVPSEDADQPERPPGWISLHCALKEARLIWVFTGCTGHFVNFFMHWLKWNFKRLNFFHQLDRDLELLEDDETWLYFKINKLVSRKIQTHNPMIFFFIWDYFTHFEPGQLLDGTKMGDAWEKPPDYPQAELGLSHTSPELGLNPQGFYEIVLKLPQD